VGGARGLAVDDAMRAALGSFAARGYDGCSVQQLARDLGVSHNLLNLRFGSKEDLWRAAVDWGFEQLLGALDDADDAPEDPLERLRATVVRYVCAAATVPELLQVMNVEGAIDGPRLRYVFDRYIRPVEVPMRALLEHLAAEGRVRPIPFRTLWFLVVGGGVSPFAQPPVAALLDPTDLLDPAAVEAHAEVVADMLMAALLPVPDPNGGR
jgi:TetR/AcrR family transcriptional regulator